MTTVIVFLRGGADGLALVPPRSPRLRDLRPTLADDDALPLDSDFAFHPALAPLLPLYRAGLLGIVHAVGSSDDTRSHFEAQDRMERGDGRSGWVARWLRRRALGGLGAIALGHKPPESFAGLPTAVFERAAEHRLASDAYAASLAMLYDGDRDLDRAAGDALHALERLRSFDVEPTPENGASYPDDVFGRRLAELARLIRANVGVEIASVDLDGWDTHVLQSGLLEERTTTLAEGLVAFLTDLGTAASEVTVVVMTEFGRRAAENASAGTDHGRGSVLFALGASVRGGRVFGPFPGLDDLEGPGDLRVTTDYRDVLAELVAVQGDDPQRVFADHRPRALGLFA